MSRREKVAVALTAIAGLVLFFALIFAYDRREKSDPTDPATTVRIGRKANPSTPVVVPDKGFQQEQDEADDASDATPADAGPEIHEDARDEQPAEAPPGARERVLETPTAGLRKPKPVGGAQTYSCPRRYVRNYSNRSAGARVEIFVLHYTVSRPGSLAAIRRLFDTPSFAASSTLGLEPSGRCEQWVPFEKKAWTQGAFNSVAESVEIMALGNEPRSWWLSQPIISKGILASIVADRLRARGLPPRRVDPAGCGVQQAGWTDHAALECGNTHHDVSPNFPYDVFSQQVRARYSPTRPRCSARTVEAVLARRLPRYEIVVDGKLGSVSRRALRYFQTVKKLDVTGRVDAKTGAALGLDGCDGSLP